MMHGRRGIFVTIIVVMLFTSVVLYSYELTKVYQERRYIYEHSQYGSRLSFMENMVSVNMQELYGIRYGSRITQNYTYHSFNSSKVSGLSSRFSEYYYFLNNSYIPLVHSNISISADTSKAGIHCDDGILVSKNYSSNSIIVYTNSTPLSNSTIYVYVDSKLVNSTPWGSSPGSPDTYIYLNVKSRSGTDVDAVYFLDKDWTNVYVLNYTDGVVYVRFGVIGIGSEGISVEGLPVSTANITVSVPSQYSRTSACYFTGSNMTYSQQVAGAYGEIPAMPIS
ncbi:MAG: hypothetical protein ACP5H8_02850 [Candidatus Micrarchaeia archaeon]